MPEDNGSLRVLLEQGYYLQALGVPAHATGPVITDAVLDLSTEHPGLQSSIVHARDRLLQHRETHLVCEAVRDRLLRVLRRRWGPFVFDLVTPATLWQRVEHETSGGESFSAVKVYRRVFDWATSIASGVQLISLPAAAVLGRRAVTLTTSDREVGFLIPRGCRPRWLLRSEERVQDRFLFVCASFHRTTMGSAALDALRGTLGLAIVAVPLDLIEYYASRAGVELGWPYLLLPIPFLLRFWLAALFGPEDRKSKASLGRWAGSTALVNGVAVALLVSTGYQGWELFCTSAVIAWLLLTVSAYVLPMVGRLFDPLVPLGAAIAFLPGQREVLAAISSGLLGLGMLLALEREPPSGYEMIVPFSLLFMGIVAGLLLLWRACLTSMLRSAGDDGSPTGGGSQQAAGLWAFLALWSGRLAVGTVAMASLAYYDHRLEPQLLDLPTIVWIAGYGVLLLLVIHWVFLRVLQLMAAAQHETRAVARTVAYLGAAAESTVAAVAWAALLLWEYDNELHAYLAPGGMIIVALALGRLWYELFIQMLRTQDQETRSAIGFAATLVGNAGLATMVAVILAYACCDMRISQLAALDVERLLVWTVAGTFAVKATVPGLAVWMKETLAIQPFFVVQFLVAATDIPAAIAVVAWFVSPAAWLPAFAIAWGAMTALVCMASWR